MGSGACKGLDAAISAGISGASEAELADAFGKMGASERDKIRDALFSEEKNPEGVTAKTIVIITTSADKISASAGGDHATGAWMEEITAPFYVFKDAGHDVSIVSIKGGKVPPEPDSLRDEFKCEWDLRMEKEDPSLLENVPDIGSIDIEKVDAIFLAGGHGTCVDFPEGLATLVTDIYAKGKIVSAVCHGPLGLINAKDGDAPLVQGKRVAGFCDEEEEAVGKFKVDGTPESKFKELGGLYSRGDAWSPHAVRDGRLVTGQNPKSSEETARLVLEALKAETQGRFHPSKRASFPFQMKIKSAEAHFHPFQVGAPRPDEAHKAIDAFCDKFASGLQDPKDDALLNLFAEDGSWADPVGGPPPYVGKEKLAERIAKLPPMDFAKVVEVFYTVNEKIFLCKTEVKFKDKPSSFFILDKFVVDEDFKIKLAEAHFHPFQVGAPRPEEAHRGIVAFCNQFASGLADPSDDALLNMFAEDGSWADPVGGPPPYTGKEQLAERITKLPPMDFAKVSEVFYTVNDKIFLCKTEVKFKDKPNSFFILDKFVVEDL